MEIATSLTLVIGILVAMGATAVILVFLTDFTTYRGYRGVRRQVRELAKTLNGTIFRDGGDLAMVGRHARFPVSVRFSNNDNTPELVIRLSAPPMPLNLSAVPKTSEQRKTKLLRTANAFLNSSYVISSDDAALATTLLETGSATADLRQLCCSGRNFVVLAAEYLEVLELTLSDGEVSRHVLDHIQAMASLVAIAEELPGSKPGGIPVMRRERHLLVRIATAVAIFVAIAGLLATTRSVNAPVAVAAAPHSDISPKDMPAIPGSSDWRVATAEDFDPAGVSWLRENGRYPSGRLPADFFSVGTQRDVAYVLTRADKSFRLVLLVNGVVKCDVTYPSIAVAARVSKDDLGSIKWKDQSSVDSEGDGILLVLNKDDVGSGLVVFFQGRALASARPLDYPTISLQ
ncbi:MAG: hypothetical protein JOY79_03900 [Acidobacteriaceae bacterium]|nr:hypothetical protein [Acidobacteriaceae bacterium]